MEHRTHEIKYIRYAVKAEMPEADAALLTRAEQMTRNSYAPYSSFHVGAAVLMESGEVYCGSNQENAAYPSGLCAERTALFYAAAQHPDGVVKAIAIAAEYMGKPAPGMVTPCGSCRQAMVQYETKTARPIKVIIGGGDGIMVFRSVSDLLPFVFSSI